MIVKKNCKWCQKEYEGELDDICCGNVECVRIQNMFPKSIIENARAAEASEICRQIHKSNLHKYHPWYIDGRSKLNQRYCEKWTPSLRNKVRAKFHIIFGERKCFECGKLEINNISKNGKLKKLSIHHVFYNIKMCCDDSERLLIPLCGSCHIKTNTNREYWTQHFIEKLQNTPKFSGECWLSKEEYKVYIESLLVL